MQKAHVSPLPDDADAADATLVRVGEPPPTALAPTPPAGWETRVPPRVGLKPTSGQVAAASGAADEARATATWTSDFGAFAPDPHTLATALTNASSWRDAWSNAQTWLAYCSVQRRLWEDAALTYVAELKCVFDHASAADVTIAKRYPSLARMVDGRSEGSRRAARARKARRARQAKGANGAPKTVPVVPDLR